MRDDAIPGLEDGDIGADRRDLASAIGDQDRWKTGNRKIAGCDGDIQVVQRGGARPNQHLGRSRHRIGQNSRAKSVKRRCGEFNGFS
jgi:hypothetical protein